MLGEARSPLMGDLMACFSAVLKEYKGEVEEILVADKQVILTWYRSGQDPRSKGALCCVDAGRPA